MRGCPQTGSARLRGVRGIKTLGRPMDSWACARMPGVTSSMFVRSIMVHVIQICLKIQLGRQLTQHVKGVPPSSGGGGPCQSRGQPCLGGREGKGVNALERRGERVGIEAWAAVREL